MTVKFRQFSFLISAPKLANCPADIGVEVAFAGRSNAGKSSAINALTDNKKLARTSKTPGRTQLINFFSIDNQPDSPRIVDLPGYGYAKVPLTTKLHWQKHLNQYLEERQSLQGLVLLMDSRQPFQDFDMMLLNWSKAAQMPIHLLLTKSDKLKPNQSRNQLFQAKKVIEDYPHASIQLFSSTKKTGLSDLKNQLNQWLLPKNTDSE
ncbi:MAG: ribosome biogenesis GTP-binding protein YihA/YsxC [Cellvibrionales bacterium]|nr:ribosome biogenesis GTP-binding protein YihA/YsxC [Cellvibrionales bacterium]